MKAFVVDHYDHFSKIPVVDNAPDPALKKGQVLCDVYSAGLNFFDILQAQGKYQHQPPFPFVGGAEFAGRISKDSPLPPGCPFKLGDRVFGTGQGAFAEKVATPWTHLLPIPKGMSYNEAAGLFVTWPTSYEALTGRAELKAGEWCLVHAGAGGVGLAAVQIAKALGAKVIATASSPSKLEVCTRYGGADEAIDYTNKNWTKEVLKITGGKGVDVIYDPVGLIRESLKCIAWKGRAVVVGFAGGEIEKLPLNLVLLKNVSVVGIHWGRYIVSDYQRGVQVWRELFDLFESGKVKPIIYSEVWPLDKLADGLTALETRKTWGKAVIRVKEDDTKAKL